MGILKDNIANSEAIIKAETVRLAALQAFVETRLEFEPAGVSSVTFYVQDSKHADGGPVHTIYAVRKTDGSWSWHGDNNSEVAINGHWNSLITSVTYGGLYPIAVVVPDSVRTISMTKDPFEPRQL